MENFFNTQGQVTPKQIAQSGPKSNLSDFMPVLVICKFEEVPLKT